MTDRKKSTIVLTVLLGLLLLLPSTLTGWEYSEFSFDLQGRIAMMGRAGMFNPYLELKGVFHGADAEFRYNSLTAGSYVRVAPWLKLGAFYRLQGGVRHNEDWIVIDNPSPTPDEHYWADVSPWRYEHLLLLDATPRFLMPFMPGGNWVGAVKARYGYNFYNNNQTLLIQPDLTWVLMRDREPVLNLTLRYPFYLALNFGDTALYGHGPYFSALWHIDDWVKLEGRLEYFMKKYTKTEFGGPWILNSSHLVIGIGVVFTPDFLGG